jgi:hypothetical protein
MVSGNIKLRDEFNRSWANNDRFFLSGMCKKLEEYMKGRILEAEIVPLSIKLCDAHHGIQIDKYNIIRKRMLLLYNIEQNTA